MKSIRSVHECRGRPYRYRNGRVYLCAMADGLVFTTPRGEVLAATARVIGRRGYRTTTVAEIALEAGMHSTEVRRLVGDEEACFHAFFDAVFHQTFNHVLKHTQGVPWPLSAREGLAAFLELAGSEPVYLHAALDGVGALGADGKVRLEMAIEAFTAFLTPGHETLAEPVTSVFLSELIGSKVRNAILRHMAEDRIAELPQALPELLSIVLTPFCAPQDIDALLTTR
jgi:AcrR family transcriptional regulator